MIDIGAALELWSDDAAALARLQGLDRASVADTMPPVAWTAGWGWATVCGLAASWSEAGPGGLTQATTDLVGGLAGIGDGLAVHIERRGDRLAFRVGARGLSGDGVCDVFRACFVGARVNAVSAPEQWGGHQRLAIVGVPRTVRVPKGIGMIERLARSALAAWAVLVIARPVARELLLERFSSLEGTRRAVSETAQLVRQLTETESRTAEDPRAALVQQLLTREAERTLVMARALGLAAQVWLLADDPTTLSVVRALVAPTVVPTGVVPFAAELLATSATPTTDPTSLLQPSDVATLVQPPAADVNGLGVTAWARFDAEPEVVEASGRRLRLGRLVTGRDLDYPADALTAHALVTGMTGSGKSTFVSALLSQLREAPDPIPTLIVEPTKQDALRAAGPEGHRWVIGDPADDSGFALNPLEVPPDIPVQTHIDLLLALFASTFALFSPLPQLLDMALRECYMNRGWDLVENTYRRVGEPTYPTLPELVHAGTALVERLGYRGEVRDNVDAAFRARVGSLAAGPKARTLDTDVPFDIARLLGADAVVNLDLVGNDDEKAFLIGLLLIRLWEARRGTRAEHLHHVTVLEEAHRILKRDAGQDVDGRRGSSFAAETFGNLLAEVRSAGEGILVVDQSPRKLTDDALANTALKVAFRSSLRADHEALASSLNLDEDQVRVLPALAAHEAIVYWEGMDRAVRAKTVYEYPRAGSAPAREPRRRRAPQLADRHLDALADVFVRAAVDERRALRDEMVTRIAELLPGADDALRKDYLVGAREGAVDRVRVSRQWARDDRRRPVVPGGLNVREGLLDGRRPYRGCRDACPAGGCLVGELVTPAARMLRATGASEGWRRLDSVAFRTTVHEETLTLLQTDGSPSVIDVTGRCLVAQVLDGEPQSVIAESLEALRGEVRGEH